MPASKNHYHERRAYCYGSERPCTIADYCASDRQNKEKGPDKFSDILVHDLPPLILD
jgi:hypothetical protein